MCAMACVTRAGSKEQSHYSALPPRLRSVGRVGGGGEGQCVEDGSFGVLRISSTDRSHCTFVCQDAGTLIGIDRIGEEMRYSLHIGTLARSLRIRGTRLCDGFEALLKLRLRLKTGNEGVAPTAQRDTPVGHRTRWIARQSCMECFNRAGKLKRVHQCHGTIELILGCGVVARIGLKIS